MDGKALAERIELAFSGVERPAESRYTPAKSGEAYDAASMFFGRDRRSLEPAFLEEYYSVLSWFTPEAWHYYLPAFLIAYVSSPGADPLYIYSIVFSLIPDGLGDYRKVRWGRLNEAQIGAVRAWLDWVLLAVRDNRPYAGKVKDAIEALEARIWW